MKTIDGRNICPQCGAPVGDFYPRCNCFNYKENKNMNTTQITSINKPNEDKYLLVITGLNDSLEEIRFNAETFEHAYTISQDMLETFNRNIGGGKIVTLKEVAR